MGAQRDNSGRSVHKPLNICSSVQHLDTTAATPHHLPFFSFTIFNMPLDIKIANISRLRAICAVNGGCPKRSHSSEQEAGNFSVHITLAGMWEDGNRANKLAGAVCICGGTVLLRTVFKDSAVSNVEVERVGDVIAHVSLPFIPR